MTADADWLAIRPQGYGEHEALDGHGDPILLEVWQGELRLLVATDINESDKAVISLEGARENPRRELRSTTEALVPDQPDHYEHPWRTAVSQVSGVGVAGALALQLIAKSLWFRCTPLPEDEFEFAVKVEHSHALQALAACFESASAESLNPSHRTRTQHPKDELSSEQRDKADADAIERLRPHAKPGQRLWMETTFCGTWCGTYRLEQPDNEFACSSRYQLVHTYEAQLPNAME